MIIHAVFQCHKRCKPEILVQLNHSTHPDPFDSISIPVNNIPDSIEGLSQEDFEIVRKFLELNRKMLIKHWNGKISSMELYRGMK